MEKLYLTYTLSVLVFFSISGSLSANSRSNRNQREIRTNEQELRELTDQFNTFRDDLTKQFQDFKSDYLIRVVALETKLEMLIKQMDRINPIEIVKLVSENQKEMCKLESVVDRLQSRIELVSEKQQELDVMNQDFTNVSDIIRQHDIKLQTVSKTLKRERQEMDSEIEQLVQTHITDNQTIWNNIKDIKQNISIIHETVVQNNQVIHNLSHVSMQQKQEITTMIEKVNHNHTSNNITLFKNLQNLSIKCDHQYRELQNFVENVTIENKKKVAFTAGIPRSESYSSSQIIKFSQVKTKIGGFNTSDGVFYCPEPGMYYFFVNIMASKNGRHAEIRKNENVVVYVYTNYVGSLKSGSNAVILQLDKSDRVYVKTHTSYTLYTDATIFSGYKM